MIIGRIPSMLQGMTQQNPKLRLPTQGELQTNGVSNPVYGLGKRNGTDHVALLTTLQAFNGFAHAIVRDDATYILYYDGLNFVVYGLNGKKYTVSADPASLQYLAAADPKRDLRALTLADTTVLLNRKKTVAMTADVSGPVSHVAVVYVKRGEYGQTYTVKLAGTDYSFTTSTTVVTELSTSFIASKLADGAHLGGVGGYTVTYTAGDSVLTVSKVGGGDFDIEARDSVGGNVLTVTKHKVPSFTDLPPSAPDGYLCKVYGQLNEDVDDYWVEFDADRASSNLRPRAARRGQWVESLAPDTAYRLDASTMPQELVRLQDDDLGTNTGTPHAVYFRLQPIEWEDRTVGDDESNPDPSFVGYTITSLFLFKNRLGFLSRGQVILSRAGDLFNFWKSSTIQSVDNDVIDIAIPTGEALNFYHALPFAEELLLIGPRAQMTISSQDALTPSSVRTSPATELVVDVGAVPTSVESSVFLPTYSGRYGGVLEYFVTGSNTQKSSAEASAQVPKLISGRIEHMSGSSLYNTLAVQSSGVTNWLYMYKWMNDGQSRVQSSWGFWTFGDPVLWFEFINQSLWLIINRPEGPTLERLHMEPTRRPTGASEPVLLDRLMAGGTATPLGLALSNDELDALEREAESAATTSGNDGEFPSGGTPVEVPNDGPTYIPGDGGGGPDPDPGTPGSPTGGSSGDPDDGGGTTPILGITYDSATDCTEITLPYIVSDDLRVVRGDTMASLSYEVVGDYTICIRGNLLGIRLFVGERYVFRYRFSPAALYRPTQYSNSLQQVPGRVAVGRWAVDFADARSFDFEVFRDGVFAKRKVCVPRRLGGFQPTSPRSGRADVLVMREANSSRVDLVNQYHTQAWFTSAQWEGDFSTRGQPI